MDVVTVAFLCSNIACFKTILISPYLKYTAGFSSINRNCSYTDCIYAVIQHVLL